MALRTFQSSDGVEWQVWSVMPGTRHGEERRGGDRRSSEPIVRYRGEERRRADRRIFETRVRPGMERGWLTCQCATERRRVIPAPPDWETLSDAALEELCMRADVVPSKGGSSA